MRKMTREEFDENFARIKKLSLILSEEEKDWLIAMLMIAMNYPNDSDPVKGILTAEENAAVISVMGKMENMMAEEEKEKS